MAFAFIAAIDPAGPAAAVCGITWTLMMPTSGVSALVAAVLCPFRKTSKQAYRLSKVAIWSGALAFFAAVVAMVGTAGWTESTPTPASEMQKISDLLQSALLGAATGIPPLLGLFTAYVSRRKLTPKVQEFPNALQSEGNKPRNNLLSRRGITAILVCCWAFLFTSPQSARSERAAARWGHRALPRSVSFAR